jgi:hypothetical protein
MYPVVKSQFRKFNEPFEGVVNYMYLDVKGLVTIGVGNLIDPVNAALGLPFRYKSNGQPASRTDILAEWNLLKGKQDLAKKGHLACAGLTKLELDGPAIDNLIAIRLQQNESFLTRQKAFLQFDQWPADAQLGLLSMAWAMGAGFGSGYPMFSAACEKMDFDAASEQCKMQETGNPGVIPRNRANKLLFANAAAVLAGEADSFYRRDTLYYPTMLMKPVTITGS